MVHQTSSNPTLNSSITILKKFPATNNQLSPRLYKKPQQPIIPLTRDQTTIKLPALVKRTPASSKIRLLKNNITKFCFIVTKPIPSAYIQDSSFVFLVLYLISNYLLYFRRLQIPSTNNLNRTVLQPTPILPIFPPRRSITLYTTPQNLPILKERMIKANLAQKASFKCKSPLPYRPDSSLSRSTTAVVTNSQLQIKTFNPLKVIFFIDSFHNFFLFHLKK